LYGWYWEAVDRQEDGRRRVLTFVDIVCIFVCNESIEMLS
jgi:hypothetical protein